MAKEKNNQTSAKSASMFAMIVGKWKQFLSLFPLLAKTLRWGWRIFLFIFIMDIGYMTAIWPDWKWIASGPVPKSAFIAQYEKESFQNRGLPDLRWQPIAFEQMPELMLKAVLAAEDHRFYRHSGIDTEAFRSAMEYNWNRKSLVYGASTISQQTAKNLFLTPSRNPFRKWHELLLTLGMEQNLPKRRILELYLNVAEFGAGVYGVEAAAQRYFGISAHDLSRDQAIELAATLPAPAKHNPRTRSAFFLKQRDKIRQNLG